MKEGVTGSPSQGREWLWEGAVALVAVVLYARTVAFGWVYDDQMEIVLNPLVHSIRNLPLLFSTTVWAGSGMESYLYRPLALASYTLNHMVSGLAPWSYHLVNVLLQAVTSVLVIRVGRLWGLSVLSAGLAGLLFAVHPIHVEVVAPVFGRKDLLATFFILAMVLLHGPGATRGGWRAALPVVAFLCAMLSKEVGVVGLALVAAQDWFLSTDRSRLARDGRRARLYIGYVSVFLVYVLVRNRVTGGLGVPDTFYMDNPLVVASLWVRISTALVVVGKGFLLQLLPYSQSPDYSFNAIGLVESVSDIRLVATLLFLTLLAVTLWRWGSSSRILPLAALWYGLALLPTANLLILVGTLFGERLLFLPSVAFCLVAGLLGGRVLEKRWKVGVVLFSLWTAGLAIQTLRYSGAWRDDITLFRAAVVSVPNSTKANHKLGEELLRAGEAGAALPYLRRAMEIAPDNVFAAQTLAQARRFVAQRYLPDGPGTALPSPLPTDPELLLALGQVSWERGDTLNATRALGAFIQAAGGGFPGEVAWARSVLASLSPR